MIGLRLFEMLRGRFAAPRRLIVVGVELSDQSGHCFNELLGYKNAAPTLGLIPQIIVPHTCEPHLAASLSAQPVLKPLFDAGDITALNAFSKVNALFETMQNLETLWAAIESHDPGELDILLFTFAKPALIAGVGRWLARRAPNRIPSVFFRIVGHEVIDRTTGKAAFNAALFRIACADLWTRPGQQNVFLLADNPAMVRVAARAGRRRVFLTPVPKNVLAVNAPPVNSTQPAVYVHVNSRSGRLLGDLSHILRRVLKAEPNVRFVVKTTALPADTRAQLQSDITGLAEMLPAEQPWSDYLENILRCNVLLLAFERRFYEKMTSGVFVEAVNFGMPVVAPNGSWMAQQIAAGSGIGATFDESDPDSVGTALLLVLRNADRLGASARAIAARMRAENSCERYLERIIGLAQAKPNMELRYEIGEEIDFSDPADSRCFMRGGWGETEDWGVWTIDRQAELAMRLESKLDRSLVLSALVLPFLTPKHRNLTVCISATGREIARWTFDVDATGGAAPQWRHALIPVRSYSKHSGPLRLCFTVDTPASPLSLGLSADLRSLGLGLLKLSLTLASQ